MKAFAEINEKGDHILVHFRYDKDTKDAVKSVPGAKFVPADKGGPHWQLPLDLDTGRRLRSAVGDGLTLGEGLRAWGRQAVKSENALKTISTADDWLLDDLIVYSKLQELAEWLRPYQRADVKFLATGSVLNLLEPRLGKTAETIASIFEAGLEDGPHLIVAPQKSLDSVWRMEWERWTEVPVYTFSGETKPEARLEMFAEVDRKLMNGGSPFVFATTADMIRRGLPDGIELDFEWHTFTIDEFHKTGLAETKNVFPQKANKIQVKRKYALSGTPMGGKPIKLWGALHFLRPDIYTSKWRWAEMWLEVEKNTVYVKGGRGRTRTVSKIGGIKPGMEDEFYSSLAPFAVRRLREEVLPQLPKKQWVDVECDMTPTQAKQYWKFHADAEVRIDEFHLTAQGILAEYTRLKQFANARNTVEVLGLDEETGKVDMKLKPTFDSGKLPYLMERLAEAGIDPEDMAGNSQAIVASQFRETVEMIYNYLTEQGIPCIRITGKVSKEESERAQRTFKYGANNEGLRVCCMVTTMGVGITMNNVEAVHIMDETWNPDDQEQLTDRAIDTTRLHQVTAFIYRSRGTIEEYVRDVDLEKIKTNKKVLDQLRKKYREAVKAAKAA